MSDISARSATPEDREFILSVCRATMTDYHRAARGWDYAQIEAAFARHIELAATQIVLRGPEPIGIVTVLRGPRADVVLRIGLLPAAQGQGIGSFLMRSIQDRGRREGRPIRLSVYKCNPSRRLYERLGFRIVGETEFDFQMIWQPPAGQ